MLYVNNFYLKNPIHKNNYYKIFLSLITQESIDKYPKNQLDRYVCVRV